MATKEFKFENYSDAELNRTQEAVEKMTDFVNNYGHSPELFVHLMANQHRTLQQSFTKLLLTWLEYAASPEYRVDGRNEATQKTAQMLLRGFNKVVEQEQPNAVGFQPSSWLPLI